MGRRKSRRKIIKPKVDNKLPTTFKCPFCSEETSVECLMEKDKKKATISCRSCKASYSTDMNSLTAPIDVYSEWIDQCEEANVAQVEEQDYDEEEFDEDST
eukprot:TRINITY_DN10242_c0_g1_i1.p1 TRINITY_DN10242_c0_g1~~TRINITY_DN10242_c0_g1_i1.p1  ORF type:complete len:101 (+),score=25.25 TRINITY_DN10242_c0_g1_i1:101-403(+)